MQSLGLAYLSKTPLRGLKTLAELKEEDVGEEKQLEVVAFCCSCTHSYASPSVPTIQRPT